MQQPVPQARRWLSGRPLILVVAGGVVDGGGFATLELLAALARRGVACVTRLRLDAAHYEPAPPPRAHHPICAPKP